MVFGYGTRFFYPPLPHLAAAYIIKFLGLFGIGYITFGMRITQWICFFASGITFFYLSLKIFKNEKTATLLSIFYMVAPYHISQVFIREAFSEMFIPIAIPLILLGLLYLCENDYKKFLFCFIRWVCTFNIFSYCNDNIFYTYDFSNIFYSVFQTNIYKEKYSLFITFMYSYFITYSSILDASSGNEDCRKL